MQDIARIIEELKDIQARLVAAEATTEASPLEPSRRIARLRDAQRYIADAKTSLALLSAAHNSVEAVMAKYQREHGSKERGSV